MGVIDINIPELITISADPKIDPNRIHRDKVIAYGSQSTDVARLEAANLATYIWENYIEPYEFPGGVWLIGAGNSFQSVAKLVTEHERVYTRLNGVIGFICDSTLTPINNHINNNAFREQSKIYVAPQNDVWQKVNLDGKRSLSKRYGTVFRSEEVCTKFDSRLPLL